MSKHETIPNSWSCVPAKIVINTTSVCYGKSRLAGQLFVHCAPRYGGYQI